MAPPRQARFESAPQGGQTLASSCPSRSAQNCKKSRRCGERPASAPKKSSPASCAPDIASRTTICAGIAQSPFGKVGGWLICFRTFATTQQGLQRLALLRVFRRACRRRASSKNASFSSSCCASRGGSFAVECCSRLALRQRPDHPAERLHAGVPDEAAPHMHPAMGEREPIRPILGQLLVSGARMHWFADTKIAAGLREGPAFRPY